MHAIHQRTFGGPDVLVRTDLPDPVPGPGQVRIRVMAAGVHRVDTMIRAGSGGPGGRPVLPMVPGREVAGVVDAVGADTDEGWCGRTVVAHLGTASGGYAEAAVASVGSLHELDPSTDLAAAVAMIGTGRTAMAVLDAARLEPDDRVLVLAASGGLGALLVQAANRIAKASVGAASEGKTSAVASLGVPAVDYGDEGWSTGVTHTLDGPPTIVIDPVGGHLGRQAFELLPPRGRHVLVGAATGTPTRLDASDLLARGVSAVGALGPHLAHDAALARHLQQRALEWLASGQWTPLLTEFPLAEAVAAHQAIEGRATVGKVLLRA